MIPVLCSLRVRGLVAFGLLLGAVSLGAQDEKHGRKYQPPPATAHIVIAVQKDFNAKPLVNAAVIFHAVKDGKDTGNMEIKTDSRGNATMDFIEAGSHVTVQIIARGFATDAEEFDVTEADKNLLVKMKRPVEQVSAYGTTTEQKPASALPGVQERVKPTTATASTPTPAPTATPQ